MQAMESPAIFLGFAKCSGIVESVIRRHPEQFKRVILDGFDKPNFFSGRKIVTRDIIRPGQDLGGDRNLGGSQFFKLLAVVTDSIHCLGVFQKLCVAPCQQIVVARQVLHDGGIRARRVRLLVAENR